MAKSKETFNKRSKEQKRLKQRQDKREKMEERKLNAKKGKSLDEMMAYIDENGNISDTPPDPKRKKSFSVDEIQISIPPGNQRDTVRSGRIDFFNDEKGFGFIIDDTTNQKIFFHVSNVADQIEANDRVQFDTQPGNRGMEAVQIKKIA